MRNLCLVILIGVILAGCMVAPPMSGVLRDAVTVENAFSGVRCIVSDTGHGTGFIVRVDKKGVYLATASHVANMPNPRVKGHPLTVIRVHEHYDLAVVRHSRYGGFDKIYTFQRPRLADRAYLLGFTWKGTARMQTRGIVSSLDFASHITYDGGVHPGMSGGPLVDERGQVLGMIIGAPYMKHRPMANPTVAICVPSDVIVEFLKSTFERKR